jgi:lincosamide nucleotidyltransferase
MLRQELLIARVRALCERDPRVVSALMYGSFARGEGDEHSDIEFYLFLAAAHLADFDREAWLREVAPLDACFENEYGTTVVFFEGLLRGEFHFEDAATVDRVRDWRSLDGAADPGRMLLVDRTGALASALEAAAELGPRAPSRALAQSLVDRLLNWLVLGSSVLRRGELARAHDALSHVLCHLLWLARLRDGALQHWATPSRALEADVNEATLERYRRCTAALDAGSLRGAYAEAWRFGRELAEAAARAFGCDPRASLFAEGIAGSTRPVRP